MPAMSRAQPRKPAPRSAAPQFFNFRNDAAVPCIELFGDIGVSVDGDWFWDEAGGAGTFKEFCDQLRALGPVPELRVEIHSYGGDVMVGKAMHDKLVEHPADKTAVIYGICASAATYPALACQTVQIPANSFFLIHNSSACCYGTKEDMQNMVDNLTVCDQSIAAHYAARTGKTEEEMAAIMEEDTWMTGTDAVAMGLADEVIEPVTIDPAQRATPENFRRSAMNAMPREARPWFDMRGFRNSAPRAANTPKSPPAMSTPVSPPPPAAPVIPPAPPPAPPAVVPPPVVADPPQNVAPPAPAGVSAADIANAVTTALAPVMARLEKVENLGKLGITPGNLAGGQVAGVGAPADSAKAAPPDFDKMTPHQLINYGRTHAKEMGTALPPPSGVIATA